MRQLSMLLLGLGVAGFAGTYFATALLGRHLYPMLRWIPLALAAVTVAMVLVGHVLWAFAVTMIACGALNSAFPVAWGAALGGLLLDRMPIAVTLIGGATLLVMASLTVGDGHRVNRCESPAKLALS